MRGSQHPLTYVRGSEDSWTKSSTTAKESATVSADDQANAVTPMLISNHGPVRPLSQNHRFPPLVRGRSDNPADLAAGGVRAQTHGMHSGCGGWETSAAPVFDWGGARVQSQRKALVPKRKTTDRFDIAHRPLNRHSP